MRKPGYIFLVSVLFVGAIALSVLGVYLLLSVASLQNGQLLESSSQAMQNAQQCTEYVLDTLLENNGYLGSEVVDLGDAGECYVLQVGGYGNENRTVCIEGTQGNITRRLEIILERILPSIQVYSWTEVASITACSY